MPAAYKPTAADVEAATQYVRQHHPRLKAGSADFVAILNTILAALQLIGPIGDAIRKAIDALKPQPKPTPTPDPTPAPPAA